ncbi:hypothetical protein Pyn_22200 [Prunus yedoensis var. nudiflora]|uniref:Uncharacterized protein n=1 Tax=Prunus yedoensis var. nudiflora TaxID=2094558 RepID=A0A315B3E4_PRUYE|nr:hypothetical protein Pyn_22200 [Prunus yedoensis var. nudiflora]
MGYKDSGCGVKTSGCCKRSGRSTTSEVYVGKGGRIWLACNVRWAGLLGEVEGLENDGNPTEEGVLVPENRIGALECLGPCKSIVGEVLTMAMFYLHDVDSKKAYILPNFYVH